MGPKKKVIDVGASSLVGLRVELAKRQQKHRLEQLDPSVRRKVQPCTLCQAAAWLRLPGSEYAHLCGSTFPRLVVGVVVCMAALPLRKNIGHGGGWRAQGRVCTYAIIAPRCTRVLNHRATVLCVVCVCVCACLRAYVRICVGVGYSSHNCS